MQNQAITSHKMNGLNELLNIEALGGPGPGGACIHYWVYSDEPRNVEMRPAVDLEINFQNGMINEVGVNGISNEALLAIVAHRLEGFQDGPYACPENGAALQMVQSAMQWLQNRTTDRVARGVEGTSEK